MSENFVSIRLRKKIDGLKKTKAKTPIYPMQLNDVYCVSKDTLRNLIGKAIKNQILPPSLTTRSYISCQDVLLLIEYLGKPTPKYPSCLLKSDVCEAYQINYQNLKNFINESELDENYKQKIYNTKILFPNDLEMIENLLGEPLTPLAEMCKKREIKYFNR